MRRARDLEPLNAMVHAMSSQVAFQGRDYYRADPRFAAVLARCGFSPSARPPND